MAAQIDKLYFKYSKKSSIKRLLSYTLFEGRPLTTSGAWINPFLFVFYNFLKKLPSKKTMRAPVFIIGTGRSGTTILGVVMSMHSKIGFLNEPKALWHSINSEEDIIGSYTNKKASLRIGAEKATSSATHHLGRLYQHYLTCVFSEQVLDKYPELIFRYKYVKAMFPDAKFIFLYRNGWDTCSSIESWSRNNGITQNNEVHNWWGRNDRKWQLLCSELVKEDPDLGNYANEITSTKDHRIRAAVEWIISMREGLKLMEMHKDSVVGVRYENLVSDPISTLKHITDFIGLDMEEKLSSYASEALISAPKKAEFELPIYLSNAFNDTMKALDY